MNKFECFFILILQFLTFLNVYSQIDTSWCDINLIVTDPENLPLPKIVNGSSLRYQAFIDKNSVDTSADELVEYYDGENMIAIAIERTPETFRRFYSYYQTNELLLITEDNTCQVFKLDENIKITPFYLAKTPDGKDQIISPLSVLFSNNDIVFKYIGKNFVRGIPVNEWQTCLNTDTPEKQSVTRITYSFSDPNKWTMSDPSAEYNSLPIQILFEEKDINGNIRNEYYTITSFKPFLTIQEEDYFTPSGIYCPGRKNMKLLPVDKIPKAFEILNQIVAPSDNDDQKGYVTRVKEEYDYDAKLFKLHRFEEKVKITEIHDYTTGLNYMINQKTGECTVNKLDTDGIDTDFNDNLIKIKNISAFFDFTDADYQWIGERRVNGVNTDVWIGRKKFNELDSTFEWYFLSELWDRKDFTDNNIATPILLIITMYLQQGGQTFKTSIYNNYHDFRPSENVVLDHDIAKCNNSIESKHFSFTLSRDLSSFLKESKNEFEVGVVKTLKKIANVSIIRISKVETLFDSKYVYVSFTLYDRSSIYGNVEKPLDDVSLEEAVNNLNYAFNNEQIEITFNKIDQTSLGVFVDQKSLKLIDERQEGIKYIKRYTYEKGYTSGNIVGVIIISLSVGFLFSIIVIELHKFGIVKLPLIDRI